MRQWMSLRIGFNWNQMESCAAVVVGSSAAAALLPPAMARNSF